MGTEMFDAVTVGLLVLILLRLVVPWRVFRERVGEVEEPWEPEKEAAFRGDWEHLDDPSMLSEFLRDLRSELPFIRGALPREDLSVFVNLAADDRVSANLLEIETVLRERWNEYERELTLHGLTGDHLRAKVAAFKRTRAALHNSSSFLDRLRNAGKLSKIAKELLSSLMIALKSDSFAAAMLDLLREFFGLIGFQLDDFLDRHTPKKGRKAGELADFV